MKSKLKYTQLTRLLRSEFDSVTRAAALLEVDRATLWRWAKDRPQRLVELTLYGSPEFNAALIHELNKLMSTQQRERGGIC